MAQTTQRDSAKKPAGETQTPVQGGMQSLRGFAQRLGFAGRDATSGSASSQRPRSRTWQFIFGMIIFVVGSQLAAYVLFFLNAQFNLGLNSIELIPTSVPLIGGMTPFLLLYLASVIGLWVLLYRFNIIPKDPFGAKAAAAARARERTSVSTVSHRTRAERRRATTSTAKSSAKTQPEPRRVATVSHGDEASDEAYERMKAAQRARRRRAAKR
ncbi:MAG TPA: hypothetical protein VGP82_13480 [Ktedonobacterales bacterium]|jgi:hypothetical protein|nr:hypothetical protein [Ktedonobacterales bacterium]